MAHAGTQGLAVVACVVDAGGLNVAQLRMTGAPLHSSRIAFDKAYTALSFRTATGVLGAQLSVDPLLREGIALQTHTILFAGGLPIHDNGCIIGGIGVSGATEMQDYELATIGRDAACVSPRPSPSTHAVGDTV